MADHDIGQLRAVLQHEVDAGRVLLAIEKDLKGPPMLEKIPVIGEDGNPLINKETGKPVTEKWTDYKGTMRGRTTDVDALLSAWERKPGSFNIAAGLMNGADGISIDCDCPLAVGVVQELLHAEGLETLAFDTPNGARFEFTGGEGIPKITEDMAAKAGFGELGTRAGGLYGLVAPSVTTERAYKKDELPPGVSPYRYAIRSAAPAILLPQSLREVLLAIREDGPRLTVDQSFRFGCYGGWSVSRSPVFYLSRCDGRNSYAGARRGVACALPA